MTYAEIYALAQDITLRHRVALAIEKRAQFVLLAGSTKPNILLNAQQALRNPDSHVSWFVNTVVMDINVQANPTNDAAIQTVVDNNADSIWS